MYTCCWGLFRSPLTVSNREEFLCASQVGRQDDIGLFPLCNLKQLLDQGIGMCCSPLSEGQHTSGRHDEDIPPLIRVLSCWILRRPPGGFRNRWYGTVEFSLAQHRLALPRNWQPKSRRQGHAPRGARGRICPRRFGEAGAGWKQQVLVGPETEESVPTLVLWRGRVTCGWEVLGSGSEVDGGWADVGDAVV